MAQFNAKRKSGGGQYDVYASESGTFISEPNMLSYPIEQRSASNGFVDWLLMLVSVPDISNGGSMFKCQKAPHKCYFAKVGWSKDHRYDCYFYLITSREASMEYPTAYNGIVSKSAFKEYQRTGYTFN